LCATVVGAALALNFSGPLHAQTAAINDLRGKIFDAKMAQQSFAGGLPHCSELDGTNFYLEARDRSSISTTTSGHWTIWSCSAS